MHQGVAAQTMKSRHILKTVRISLPSLLLSSDCTGHSGLSPSWASGIQTAIFLGLPHFADGGTLCHMTRPLQSACNALHSFAVRLHILLNTLTPCVASSQGRPCHELICLPFCPTTQHLQQMWDERQSQECRQFFPTLSKKIPVTTWPPSVKRSGRFYLLEERKQDPQKK